MGPIARTLSQLSAAVIFEELKNSGHEASAAKAAQGNLKQQVAKEFDLFNALNSDCAKEGAGSQRFSEKLKQSCDDHSLFVDAGL
jgi:hypothetical protein